MVGNHIGDSLSISSRTASATVDAIMNRRELVSDAVGDVGAGSSSRIGTDDNTLIKLHSHDGGLGIV